MKDNNIRPKRTIHLTFVPGTLVVFFFLYLFLHVMLMEIFFFKDEEIGGVKGLGGFVKMREFKDLNIGVALDEGLFFEYLYFLTNESMTFSLLDYCCQEWPVIQMCFQFIMVNEYVGVSN
jgi:hypothetical protein